MKQIRTIIHELNALPKNRGPIRNRFTPKGWTTFLSIVAAIARQPKTSRSTIRTYCDYIQAKTGVEVRDRTLKDQIVIAEIKAQRPARRKKRKPEEA